jgi:tetratricopeptide (TPR) repeat protein
VTTIPSFWSKRACDLVNRNLTGREWAQFLPGEPYRPTCLPNDALNPTQLINLAEAYALTGEMEQAKATFQQAVQAAVKTNHHALNNYLCWHGSVLGLAEIVLPACEHALALVPDDGGYRDSRGLARALTGDYAGAIEDFQYYVDWATERRPDNRPVRRQAWIADLKAGRNPFDEAALVSLQGE